MHIKMFLFRKSKLFLTFSKDECHLKNSDFFFSFQKVLRSFRMESANYQFDGKRSLIIMEIN